MKVSSKNSKLISLSESNFLKGLGIMLIFTHNYFHWSGGTGIENEMYFRESNFFVFKINFLKSIGDFFIYSSSFFGHFGVQIFIFISAYGLTVKYKDVKLTFPSYTVSVLPRYVNIVFLFCVGVLLTKIILLFFTDNKHSAYYFFYFITITITTYKSFFKNLMYEYMGPYWYFAIAIQIYLLHPFFVSLATTRNRFTFKIYSIFIILSYLISIPLYYCLKGTNISVFSNIIGHLPELFLAIYLGINGLKIHSYLFLFLVPLLVLTQIYEWLFAFSFLIACLSLLSLGNFLYQTLPGFVSKGIGKIGKISMIIFILNGPLRLVPYFKDDRGQTDPSKFFQFALLLLGLSYIIYLLYNPVANIITQKTRRISMSFFKQDQGKY